MTSERKYFLQIRLSKEERKRLESLAEKDYLHLSTWARQVLLRAAEPDEDDDDQALHAN